MEVELNRAMCKVDTLIEEYGLTAPGSDYHSVDEYLANRWTGEDGRSPQGYKKLTEWFNKRVLKSIYEEHGRSTVSIHLEREYDVIVNDDNIQRAELTADLKGDGIDIDELKQTLVSHGTIRNHLKNCLGVEKDTQSSSRYAERSWEKTVASAKRLAASKTRNILPNLTASGDIPHADEANIDIEIKLRCPECDMRVPFEDAIERGYICDEHMANTGTTNAHDDPITDSPNDIKLNRGETTKQQLDPN